MSIFDRKRKAAIEEAPEEIDAPPKKKPRGRPFTGVGDPRNNLKGRPKTGEALAEHIRVLLDAPMKRTGSDQETTALDAGLIALANAFIAGDPLVAKLLLDRGWGKLPEQILLSKTDQEPRANWDAIPLEALKLMSYWGWLAAGSPALDTLTADVTRKEYDKIQKAIDDSHILELVKEDTNHFSPSLVEGGKEN